MSSGLAGGSWSWSLAVSWATTAALELAPSKALTFLLCPFSELLFSKDQMSVCCSSLYTWENGLPSPYGAQLLSYHSPGI